MPNMPAYLQVFKVAKVMAPSLIYIDEIEKVGWAHTNVLELLLHVVQTPRTQFDSRIMLRSMNRVLGSQLLLPLLAVPLAGPHPSWPPTTLMHDLIMN